MAGENITTPVTPAATTSCSSASSSADYSRVPPRSDSGRSLAGDHRGIRTSVDLVAAASRHLSFLRSVSGLPLLRRSVRRYEELWMPLISELSPEEMLLPPLDVQWVWHCHCLRHANYRDYCASRFGKLIDRPVILDDENEEYAMDRCCEIWETRYPSEPFDLESSPSDDRESDTDHHNIVNNNMRDLFDIITKCGSLFEIFADAFVFEPVFLVAAKRRYFDFLDLLKKLKENDFSRRLIPTADILLMWLTHQSFPASYAKDMKEIGADVAAEGAVGLFDGAAAMEEMEETRRAWEEMYGEPYERAGMAIDPTAVIARQVFNWESAGASDDVNRVYRGLQPRFLMEVFVFLKGEFQDREQKTFLRLRTLRSHKTLKLDINPKPDLSPKTWNKTWHLFCEFATKGISIEIRKRASYNCIQSSKRVKTVIFTWNELLRAPKLALAKDPQVMSSLTSPVQAPYLLKCVADRVTDDSGAMVSDFILRLRQYRPQEGRWITRTVLDHCGRECFVIRARVGRGIWRRGAETPALVKYEERIIEVREGPWSYINASSIGYAPEKVVGTATPKREDTSEKKRVIWSFSMGYTLSIEWGDDLQITLENQESKETANLLGGRRLQYQTNKSLSSKTQQEEQEENYYFTLIRPSPLSNRETKATALINYKLLAVEFSPKEDAVLVLLICMAIARTLSEIRRDDVAGLLVRRRIREVQAGQRDWGSVILPYNSCNSDSDSDYVSLNWNLRPWYWNAREVLAPAESEILTKYSPADGKDLLYRQAFLP